MPCAEKLRVGQPPFQTLDARIPPPHEKSACSEGVAAWDLLSKILLRGQSLSRQNAYLCSCDLHM